MLDKYESTLLEGWEEIHKRSQLSLWILLALRDSPRHMAQIRSYITEMSANTVSVDEKSLYRALRRIAETEMIEFATIPNASGPDLKLYRINDMGKRILNEFLRRNIMGPLLRVGMFTGVGEDFVGEFADVCV